MAFTHPLHDYNAKRHKNPTMHITHPIKQHSINHIKTFTKKSPTQHNIKQPPNNQSSPFFKNMKDNDQDILVLS